MFACRGEPEYIETILFPSTGEDSQSQYVCVTLIVRLPSGYPDISPVINLRNPRGLDEDTVKLMQFDAEAKCKDFIGQPVMFELIEVKNYSINFLFFSSIIYLCHHFNFALQKNSNNKSIYLVSEVFVFQKFLFETFKNLDFKIVYI